MEFAEQRYKLNELSDNIKDTEWNAIDKLYFYMDAINDDAIITIERKLSRLCVDRWSNYSGFIKACRDVRNRAKTKR
jgi:hypothetical protein